MKQQLITDVAGRKHIINSDHIVSIFFNESNRWYYINMVDGNSVRVSVEKFPEGLTNKEWLEELKKI